MLTNADILLAQEYERVRPLKKQEILLLKEARRVAVGPDVTFYFENAQTIWWQIQEMLRIEKGGNEQAVDELVAYNPLIPIKREKGYEVSATMIIEIDDPMRRQVVLNQLSGIDQHIMFALQNAAIPAFSVDLTDEHNCESDHKTSAVHFLKWLIPADRVGAFLSEEVYLVINHPYYSFKTSIPLALKNSLEADFEVMG